MKNLFSENDVTVEFFNNELLVKGPLTQDTVVAAIKRSEPLIPHEQSVTINLSEVRDCDSASLAFIMALLRVGKAKKS
ncbi:MAG TPA: STAS domain-containing protein, partial [Candidatus Berkiella sp.]|nr:STAS domain-containing protein [Candidatus Berkiella sp.]